MKFNPFCMCCAVSKQEQNIRSFQDMDKKVEYMKRVMDRMANIAEEDCAPSVSVELKKMFRDFWEQPMEDYTSVKKKYNQLMLDMEASLEETIRNSEDPLETALLYARIGNYIDFAALSNVNSDTVLSLLKEDNKEPLNAQEYLHFRKDLSAASRLVYLTDNCGEIVLDKLVIILLKELCPELDITVIGNGNEVGGTWLPHISSEAREALESADLIIAKGQGNYETLRDSGLNIYYLFLCKCKWFQYQFNAKPLQGMFINERRI